LNQSGIEISLDAGQQIFRLRPAAATDQQTIKQMVRSARLNPIGLNWQRFILAVTADDQIIGCVQLKPHRGGVLELASLVVIKGWRRKGVARLLIENLKETAEPPIWLMCMSRLKKFYEPFGFRQVRLGEPMPGYYRWMLRMTFIINRLGPPGQSLTIMVWDMASSEICSCDLC
jgi:N-acetylglutamate synthase-like GNAT family acetyltransferase